MDETFQNQPVTSESESHEDSMPLWQHLEELRGVLLKSLLIVSLGFCVTYYFSERLIQFLEAPILTVLPTGEKNLYFTGITDKFLVYLKVSFYCSLILSSPFLLKQIWNFVSPALKENERKFAVPFLILGTLAFLVGVAFAYYLVIPSGYQIGRAHV